MDGPRWFNGTHRGGESNLIQIRYMVILRRVILHWKCVHGLGWQEKQTPIVSWGREFRRLFRGISWVYEITKYFRYKKTMADGEEDEYEAHLDHLQRSKDLKAKSCLGNVFSNISLKGYESPTRYWKINIPSKWMTHLLKIGFKTSEIGEKET